MTQSSPLPSQWIWASFQGISAQKVAFGRHREQPPHPHPPNEYGKMVKEYRPKRENGQGIYGSHFKLCLPKKWVCNASNLGKKSNFRKTQSSPPPLPNEYGQMVTEYRPKRENGQGIYGSLYKLSLPEKSVCKAYNFRVPVKKKVILSQRYRIFVFPRKSLFFRFLGKNRVSEWKWCFCFPACFFFLALWKYVSEWGVNFSKKKNKNKNKKTNLEINKNTAKNWKSAKIKIFWPFLTFFWRSQFFWQVSGFQTFPRKKNRCFFFRYVEKKKQFSKNRVSEWGKKIRYLCRSWIKLKPTFNNGFCFRIYHSINFLYMKS